MTSFAASTGSVGAGRAGRPRGPALVQLALSLAIAVLLISVTLTTRQPPPPAIAEFAPQAAEQIKEQPKEQASEFGSGAGAGDCPPGAMCAAGDGAGRGAGDGGAGPGGAGPTSTTAAPAVGGGSLKRCVGDPPRQIEDPQSPPCIATWDDSKGNGGATWSGVTKDEIIVAAPEATDAGLYPAMTAFFNDRFQFYGRKIKIIKPSSKGTAGADDAKQQGAFASVSSFNDGPYFRQLAKHKIIGVYRTPDYSDSELAAMAPYIWGYTMSFTQMMANLADWACHRLVGQKANHAGRIDQQPLSASPRTFAIFLDLGTPDTTVKHDLLKAGLEQCGAKVPFDTRYPRGQNTDPIRIRGEIARIKDAGVTTVICLCPSNNMIALQAQADLQQYEPEWIITSYPQLVQPEGWKNASQIKRTFGLSFGPMDRVNEDHPVTWALREGDPTGAAVATSNIGNDDQHYRSYLALAAGLQMAGPNLTPETFRAGLRRTKFPNPDHPIMAGTVGFAGDFSMTDDAAEFWWGDEPGPYQGRNPSGDEKGTFCWVDGGRRHARGTWPKTEDPFFQGPCESGRRSVS